MNDPAIFQVFRPDMTTGNGDLMLKRRLLVLSLAAASLSPLAVATPASAADHVKIKVLKKGAVASHPQELLFNASLECPVNTQVLVSTVVEQGDVHGGDDGRSYDCTGKWQVIEVLAEANGQDRWASGSARVTVTATNTDGSETDTDTATLTVVGPPGARTP